MKWLYNNTPVAIMVSDEDEMFLCVLNFYQTQAGYLCCTTQPFVDKYIQQIVGERMGLIVPPGFEIDHEDRNKLNNQRSNLRIATKSQNGANRLIQLNNTSGHKGVSKAKGNNKYRAQIWVNRQRIHLGYGTYEECVKLYRDASIKYHGSFSCLED